MVLKLCFTLILLTVRSAGGFLCPEKKCVTPLKRQRTTSPGAVKYGNLMDASCQPLYRKETVT